MCCTLPAPSNATIRTLLRRIHEYLEKFDGADRTKEHIIRFERKMSRYHDYQREILGNTDFMLFVETVTLEQMNDFRDYVVNEYLLRQEHPDFYAPTHCLSTASPSRFPARPSSTS